MFDPFTLALIGGAVGGLLDKKDPLRGAALGAGAGYVGPGLLGASGTSAGAVGVAPAGAMSVPGAMGGMSTTASMAPSALGGTTLGQSAIAANATAPWYETALGAMKEAKPYAEAAGNAVQVAGMFKQPEQAPITPSPFMQPNTPSMPMNNLVAQLNQGQQLRQQADMQRRARRQSLIG